MHQGPRLSIAYLKAVQTKGGVIESADFELTELVQGLIKLGVKAR